MQVIDVIPFSAGAPAGSLSYRSSEKMSVGAIVDVTLRGSRVRGVVVACESVRDAKGSLKTASFMLKSGKLAKVGALPAAVMQAAKDVAEYHAAPIGSVLSALLAETLPTDIPTLAKGEGFLQRGLEKPYLERMADYRSLIAQSPGAVMLVAPTTIELARFAELFAELKPLVLSGALKGPKREAALAAASRFTGLVIVSPAFIWTPISKLSFIILERAGAGSYSFIRRPYLDARVAAVELARARELPIVLADYPLPLEWRINPSAALKPSAARPLAPVQIIDARKERLEGEKFKAVPDAIMKGIGRALANGGRAAVLAVRKGYSPTVVCRDCGTAVHDAEGRALSFSTARGERVFRSADGSTIESTERKCDNCGSWNLFPLGIGVERVVEEVKAAVPDAIIVQIDADTVRTPAQAKRAAQAARAPGTIIIGTELMIPFLDPAEPLEYAAIASADALLSLPFWRARERLVHAGLALRERALSVGIATRRSEDTTFTAIADPSNAAFFAEESAQRTQFAYPPFGNLLRVRALVSPNRRDEAAHAILSAFEGTQYPPVRMPDRKAKTKIAITFLAKMPADAWPNEPLSNALASLPPSISVLVDTESLW